MDSTELINDILKKMGSGEKIDPAEFKRFVDLQNADLKTGPAVGSKVPDFALEDQNDRRLTLHDLMGPKGMLLVFTRSADWWPFCRTQLVELQQSLPALQKAGLRVAAVSYDSKATLKRFADAHQITYPLLSDQGSAVIRKFGILNTNIPDGNMFHGIPFPGDYVLAADGTVKDKHFLPNYQTRPTASGILLADFNVVGDQASVGIGAEDVQAKISLSSVQAAPGQALGVAVAIAIAPGWHIYGQPLPENYVATSLTFAGDAVAQQSVALPPAVPLEFKALGETLPVYEGSFQGRGSIVISGRAKPGPSKITGTFRFQECNDTICKLPQEVPFEIPIKIEAMVPGLKN